MKFAAFIVILGGVAACNTALAQPVGGFYLFKHKESGKVVCYQQVINSDWARLSGPFQDSDCKIEEKPKARHSDLPASPLDLAPKK